MCDRRKPETELPPVVSVSVSVSALGPPSGWVFCGADQWRNRFDHAAHRFCRCATPRKALVDSDRARAAAAPEVGGGDSGGDSDNCAEDSSRERKETMRPAPKTVGRDAGLPLAIECCIATYLSQACHARAARTSTAMRRLCERREASPRVVTCRGIPNTSGRDSVSDLVSSRDVWPNGYSEAPYVAKFRWRWMIDGISLCVYATLDPEHPLLCQRRLAPRVLDLHRVRLQSDAFERLLGAVSSPTFEMLCVDAKRIDRVATRVGRHAPGLLCLCLYDTYAGDAETPSATDPYGDWLRLTRLTDLTLPATETLASQFCAASRRLADGISDPLVPPPPPPPLPPTLTRLTLLLSSAPMSDAESAEFECTRIARFLPLLRDLTTPAAPSHASGDSPRAGRFSRLVVTRDATVAGRDNYGDNDGNDDDDDDDECKNDGEGNDRDGRCARHGDGDNIAAQRHQDRSVPATCATLATADVAGKSTPPGRRLRHWPDTRSPVHVAEFDVTASDRDFSFLAALSPGALRSLVFRAGPSGARRQLRHVLERFTALERLVLDGAHAVIDARMFDLVCRRLPRLACLAFSCDRPSEFADFRRTADARAFFAPLGLPARLCALDFGATYLPDPDRSAAVSVAGWDSLGSASSPTRFRLGIRNAAPPASVETVATNLHWLPTLPLLREYRAEQRTDLVRLLRACPALTALRVSYSSFGYRSDEDAATDAVARHLQLHTLALIEHRWTFDHNAHDTVRKVRERRRCAYIAKLEREQAPGAGDTAQPAVTGGERKRGDGVSSESSTHTVDGAHGLTIEVAWCHDPFRASDSGSRCAGSSRLRLCTRDNCGSVGQAGATGALFSGADSERYSPTASSAAKSVLCICAALRANARHCVPAKRCASSASVNFDAKKLLGASDAQVRLTRDATAAFRAADDDDDASGVANAKRAADAATRVPMSRSRTRSGLRSSRRAVNLEVALATAGVSIALTALSVAAAPDVSDSFLALAFTLAAVLSAFVIGVVVATGSDA